MEEGGTYDRNKACQISYETEMRYWEELNQQNGKESVSVRCAACRDIWKSAKVG